MDPKSKVKWNPFTSGYFENPYLHLEDCRQNNPVQKVYDNAYFLFRYKDINTFLREKDFKVHSLTEYLGQKEDYIFKKTENTCPYLSKSTELWPMYLDNEIHRKIRRAITKAFHALPVQNLIAESLEKTLAIFKNQNTFNLVDFCGRFIYYFVKEALKIDNKVQYERIKYFSNLVAKLQDLYIPKQVYQEINSEIVSLKNVFKSSVFKNEILRETKDLHLSEDSLYSIILVSFMAAFETSKDNLSLALYEILKKPELIDSILASDKKRLKLFIEETFRLSSPLQFTVRINTYPLQIGDYRIPENSKLYLCLASANRDPEIFEHPNELIPYRINNPHLAFGAGTHKCLGATIARQEMELCLKPMLHFLKDYNVEKIKWSKQILMRTANTIMVKKK
jgi:cytochrome P450